MPRADDQSSLEIRKRVINIDLSLSCGVIKVGPYKSYYHRHRRNPGRRKVLFDFVLSGLGYVFRRLKIAVQRS